VHHNGAGVQVSVQKGLEEEALVVPGSQEGRGEEYLWSKWLTLFLHTHVGLG
jgi:hypothetical protein